MVTGFGFLMHGMCMNIFKRMDLLYSMASSIELVILAIVLQLYCNRHRL